MNIIKTNVLDVYILEPEKYGDNRGWFMESWSQRNMIEAGLNYSFVQDNHSYSEEKGTLRGLHMQVGENSQAKLVRCVKGAVIDVAVDLRIGSPTYKGWVSIELSAVNNRQLIIPRGFAHGFMTITDNVEFLYKADNYYEPQSERSIIWNDLDINIDWRNEEFGICKPILSLKDATAPKLNESDINYNYYNI